MTQTELARAAGVGQSTVIDFERARRTVAEPSVQAIRSALEAAGIEFVNSDRPGVRLARRPDG